MFNLTYSAPAEIQGTIRLPSNYWRLGPCEDLDGNKWHIYGFGHGGCWASPLGQTHSYYMDTSGNNHGMVQQTWMPYDIERVEEIKENNNA